MTLGLRKRALWTVLVMTITSVAGHPTRALAGGLLDPASFASLGQLPDESGTYTVNSSGATPTMTLPDGSTINGVLDPSGQVAVFTFNAIQLDNSAIIAQGSRPLALLSQGNITLSGETINLSASAPFPGAAQTTPGAGGYAGNSSPGGPGAGGFAGFGAGGGAGYGGVGGAGAPGYIYGGIWSGGPYPGGTGGAPYGGPSAPLQGGSAGTSGFSVPDGGGAGGGAIELGASGNLQFNRVDILAAGGSGAISSGGGSGGSISLLGQTINLQGTTLAVPGGDGGGPDVVYGDGAFSTGSGGGGGGGIIDIVGDLVGQANYNVIGGSGDSGAQGQVFLSSVPEPPAHVLGIIAALAGLVFSAIQRLRVVASLGERARL
jgi:hypothetical protein